MNILIAMIVIGIVLIGRAVYVATKIKKDPETKKYGNNPQLAVIVLSVVGALLFVIGSIGLPVADAFKPDPPDALKTKDNSTMAYVMMQGFVKDYLISPSSAKFEWISEPQCIIIKEEFDYSIRSWVDSQNAFGVMIRTQFSGVVRQVDERNWQLLELDFDE